MTLAAWPMGLVLLPWLLALGLYIFRRGPWRQRPMAQTYLRYPTVALWRGMPTSRRARLRRHWRWLRLVSLSLLVVALMRPQTGRTFQRDLSRGVDIVLAIDTSRSMEALDLDADRPIAQRRSRLGVVREAVADFVQRRPNDQLGLVVFGAEAYTHCPLTLDHGMVAGFLSQIASGMAGDMTAIGSGLAAAVRRLSRSPAKSKVVILLTDGSNNAGPIAPKKAAELALALGIKVYTIGAGSRGEAPFLVDTPFGKQVQYAAVDIDEVTLRQISDITHGAYFRAEDRRALGQIYQQIDRLEKSDIENRGHYTAREAFMPWVWLALILWLVEAAGWHTFARKLP